MTTLPRGCESVPVASRRRGCGDGQPLVSLLANPGPCPACRAWEHCEPLDTPQSQHPGVLRSGGCPARGGAPKGPPGQRFRMYIQMALDRAYTVNAVSIFGTAAWSALAIIQNQMHLAHSAGQQTGFSLALALAKPKSGQGMGGGLGRDLGSPRSSNAPQLTTRRGGVKGVASLRGVSSTSSPPGAATRRGGTLITTIVDEVCTSTLRTELQITRRRGST
jgi:hypothetical protein